MRAYRGAAERIFIGGRAVIAVYGGNQGGMIYNPPEEDEPLFLSFTGPVDMRYLNGTVQINPGETFAFPAGLVDIWVNAETSGHRFSAVVYQPDPAPATPYAGEFPPAGPVTRADTLPSYLYKQYEDDDDLQAFVAAHNAYTQLFIDWFNTAGIPIYTKHAGELLDWVAGGLYGIARPTLYSGTTEEIGPFNTYGMLEMTLAERDVLTQYENVARTTDDVFKRILTWHLFKGDGRAMTIMWLRRRVARFLFIADGKDGPAPIDQIAVFVSASRQITIVIVTEIAMITHGAMFNSMGFNDGDASLNYVEGESEMFDEPDMAKRFVEAISSGNLETPAAHTITARVGAIGAHQ